VAHTDFDAITSLDALIDVSDAGARAAMLRLRERLAALDAGLDSRVVHDGLRRKPTIAWYRRGEPLLHVYPEPGAGLGLHVAVPLRTWERDLLRWDGLAPWLREAADHARRRGGLLWIDATLHSPGRVDDLAVLLARRLDLLPRG
jgi:hypothetical protein